MIKFERNSSQSEVLESMVEVEFVDGSEQGFRKVKETLQRMGLPKSNEKTLFQTAHVLHKRGRYYICHFKSLFALDGREAELDDSDLGRLHLIVKYLVEWNLIKPISNSWKDLISSPSSLKVIRYQDRDEWDLQAKHKIGSKRS